MSVRRRAWWSVWISQLWRARSRPVGVGFMNGGSVDDSKIGGDNSEGGGGGGDPAAEDGEDEDVGQSNTQGSLFSSPSIHYNLPYRH